VRSHPCRRAVRQFQLDSATGELTAVGPGSGQEAPVAGAFDNSSCFSALDISLIGLVLLTQGFRALAPGSVPGFEALNAYDLVIGI
jgi:hypothetical protein